MSDSLWHHGLQHARPPCPSPTPRACSNSCPLSRWYHPTISSSTTSHPVVRYSSCLQSSTTSGSFPLNWLLTPCGQSIGALASASVLPVNIQGWFPQDWLVWSPGSPRDCWRNFAFNFSLGLQVLNGSILIYFHECYLFTYLMYLCDAIYY